MNEKIKAQILKLYEDGKKLFYEFAEDKKDKKIADLRQRYQNWYTRALIAVKDLLPSRYDEFIESYRNTKRRDITCVTYSISDYFLGITVSRAGIELFDSKSTAMCKFANQINIIKSIEENIDNVLFNIRNNIEFEVLDNEIDSVRKLISKGFYRSAGALGGVVLEKHFETVLKNHNLKMSKKTPCISDYNDLFKQENVYDTIQWRQIQLLGDIRNLCDHSKGREPSKDEVEDLINGIEKVIKSVF